MLKEKHAGVLAEVGYLIKVETSSLAPGKSKLSFVTYLGVGGSA